MKFATPSTTMASPELIIVQFMRDHVVFKAPNPTLELAPKSGLYLRQLKLNNLMVNHVICLRIYKMPAFSHVDSNLQPLDGNLPVVEDNSLESSRQSAASEKKEPKARLLVDV